MCLYIKWGQYMGLSNRVYTEVQLIRQREGVKQKRVFVEKRLIVRPNYVKTCCLGLKILYLNSNLVLHLSCLKLLL